MQCLLAVRKWAMPDAATSRGNLRIVRRLVSPFSPRVRISGYPILQIYSLEIETNEQSAEVTSVVAARPLLDPYLSPSPYNWRRS